MNIEGNDQFNIKVLLLLVFFFYKIGHKGITNKLHRKTQKEHSAKKKKIIFSQVV